MNALAWQVNNGYVFYMTSETVLRRQFLNCQNVYKQRDFDLIKKVCMTMFNVSCILLKYIYVQRYSKYYVFCIKTFAGKPRLHGLLKSHQPYLGRPVKRGRLTFHMCMRSTMTTCFQMEARL